MLFSVQPPHSFFVIRLNSKVYPKNCRTLLKDQEHKSTYCKSIRDKLLFHASERDAWMRERSHFPSQFKAEFLNVLEVVV
jgi:hypothetical protein